MSITNKASMRIAKHNIQIKQQRAHPDLNQGPADLQSAALTTELCTHIAISITRLCSETKDLMDRWVIDSVTRMAPRLARCEDSNPIGEPHSGMGRDTLPEWSKGVDSSSTSASCVGSNPTGVILGGLSGSLL